MAETTAHSASTNEFLASIEGEAIWDETALTYFFAQSGDSAAVTTEDNEQDFPVFAGAGLTFDPLNSTDAGDAGIRNDVLAALEAWARVANIPTFTAAADFDDATFKVVGVDGWGGTLGQMDFPGTNMVGTSTTEFESMLYLSTSNYLSDRGEVGGAPLGIQNALHELGHGLGLGHIHDDGHGTTDVSDEAASGAGDVVWDNERFTVMSYEKGGWNVNTAGTFGRSVTPMALDIAAMQNMYGATSLYEGDNTYTLTDAGTAALDTDGSDGDVSIGRAFYSIWDTDGTDEIEYGGANRSVINLNNATLSTTDDDRILDLTDSLLVMDGYQDLPDEVKNNIESADYHGGGFFSSIFDASGTMQLGGFSIASDFKDSDAKIENATGGTGDDVLIGNELDNILTGNGGDDMLSGSDGDDSVLGGAGDDHLSGGQGDDTLNGGSGEDKAYFLDTCDNYEISKDTDTGIVTITHVDGTTADGTDTLVDVEFAIFADDTVDLTVDVPTCSPIDFIFLVDLSGSFADDLPAFTAAAPAIFDSVRDLDPDAQFAVASFVDYPFSPYGSPGDYLYQPELALTGDRTAFQTALGGLTIRSGGDFPESQWAGIWGAANGVGLGLRENSRKIILIATDAEAHSASDYGLAEDEVLDFLEDNSITAIGGEGGAFIDPTDIGDTSPDYVGDSGDSLLDTITDDLFGDTSIILALTPGTEEFYEDALPSTLATSIAPLSSSGDDISDAVSFGLADLSGSVTESGTNDNDTLVGTSDADALFGLGGNDEITGLAGNDTLDGGSGFDTVFGGSGDDVVRGGTGDDELDGGTGDDDIDGGAGADDIFDGLGNNTVEGRDGNDVALVLAGANTINGGADADVLIGGIQADTLDGGTGNDIIRGEASDGFMAGSDRIIGGTGNDTMMGGRGADTFVFNTADGTDVIGTFAAADITEGFFESTVTTTGADFMSGVDKIELSGFALDDDTVLDAIEDNADGVAVFSAEGTEITFTGLTASDLSADDFVFV